MSKGPSAAALRMRALAIGFPESLRVGFSLGRELAPSVPRGRSSAVVAGMGGSAIAADLFASLIGRETELSLSAVRGPIVPSSVGPRTIVVLESYSGNTWETLAAYEDAGRRGACRLAIASGGELARRAEQDRVPLLTVPPGLPPRSALGYLMGGLMGLLDAFFPESNEARLARATERLGERQPEYAGPDGAPARLARRIGRRRPHIYAPYDVVSVAHRWRTQVEENAKRLADHGALPEILHNSILAWNAIGSPEARRSAVVLLEPMAGNGTAGLAAGYFADLLKRRRVPVERIRLGLDDRLEAILTGVSFGDHLSLFLAEAEGVDPLEMRAIERMKASLSRTTAEGPARVR